MLISLSRRLYLSGWWTVSIDANVHTGAVECVTYWLQPVALCAFRWVAASGISGCVVGELKCPLLTVLTLDHSLLIWKRGSSLCDQMYGFCYQLGFLKAFCP